MWSRRRWVDRQSGAPGAVDWRDWTVTFDSPHVGVLRYVLVEVFAADGRSLHRQLLEPGTDLRVADRVLRIRDITEDVISFRTAEVMAIAA